MHEMTVMWQRTTKIINNALLCTGFRMFIENYPRDFSFKGYVSVNTRQVELKTVESTTIPALGLGLVHLWCDISTYQRHQKAGARRCPNRCGLNRVQSARFKTTQLRNSIWSPVRFSLSPVAWRSLMLCATYQAFL
jgi:hypothetical protein